MDHEIDLSVFEHRYLNDETGAPAYDPAVLLKVVLYVSTMGEEIESVFTDVLTVCYSAGLIGWKTFAIDGCKISANCSKDVEG